MLFNGTVMVFNGIEWYWAVLFDMDEHFMKFINSMNVDECILVFYTFNFGEFLNMSECICIDEFPWTTCSGERCRLCRCKFNVNVWKLWKWYVAAARLWRPKPTRGLGAETLASWGVFCVKMCEVLADQMGNILTSCFNMFKHVQARCLPCLLYVNLP